MSDTEVIEVMEVGQPDPPSAGSHSETELVIANGLVETMASESFVYVSIDEPTRFIPSLPGVCAPSDEPAQIVLTESGLCGAGAVLQQTIASELDLCAPGTCIIIVKNADASLTTRLHPCLTSQLAGSVVFEGTSARAALP